MGNATQAAMESKACTACCSDDSAPAAMDMVNPTAALSQGVFLKEFQLQDSAW